MEQVRARTANDAGDDLPGRDRLDHGPSHGRARGESPHEDRGAGADGRDCWRWVPGPWAMLAS